MPDDIGRELATDLQQIHLSRLTTEDTDPLFDLVQQNKNHLNLHGDFRDLTAKTREQIYAELAAPRENEFSYAIRKETHILGVVTLIAYKPKIFGIGYWIGADHTGHHYVTSCCRALIAETREVLGAQEIWAGITHGNSSSISVVTRLEFVLMRDQATHLSYALHFDD